jgi:hypothetical protein
MTEQHTTTTAKPAPFRWRNVTIAVAVAVIVALVATIIHLTVSFRDQRSMEADESSPLGGMNEGDAPSLDYATLPPTSIAPNAAPAPVDVHVDSTPPPPPLPQNNVTILAYYYPWYEGNDWSRHGYVGTPVLGLYDTSDPTVAEQHIEWAAPATDVLVISWWGEDGIAADHLHRGFLNARNLHKTKFCLIYESMGRLQQQPNETGVDFANELVMQQLIEDFQFLKDEYFGHEQYYKLDDGRPVVVMYVTRIFRNFHKQYLIDLQEAIGMDLFIIGDEPFFRANDNPFTAYNGIYDNQGDTVFEAYTAYNMFENEYVAPGESATDYMMREAMPVYERWSADTLFYPNILTSYHDFRGHEPLLGGKEGFLQQLEAFSCLPKPQGLADTIPNMMFVTSFNEWWEGTTIEPAAEYGNIYLDALVEFRSSNTGCN